MKHVTSAFTSCTIWIIFSFLNRMKCVILTSNELIDLSEKTIEICLIMLNLSSNFCHGTLNM